MKAPQVWVVVGCLLGSSLLAVGTSPYPGSSRCEHNTEQVQ